MDNVDSQQGALTAAIAPIEIELVDARGEGTVLVAELGYLAEDPYAVSVSIPTLSGPVTWRFARDLLATGVFDPAGDGDVQIWPSLSATGIAVTLVELRGADGTSVHLEAPSDAVLQFLGAAADVVAPGTESAHLDLEGLVAELLGDAR
jgi:hypothetical protein